MWLILDQDVDQPNCNSASLPLTMSDVRALLKAKRQEVPIAHPLAAYSASGQLRCLACGTAVKQSASWNGHIGSKAHRIAAARYKEEERRRREQEEEEMLQRKRKLEEDGDEEENARKKPHIESEPAPNGMPTDFFSDPSQAPPASDDSDDTNAPAEPSAIDAEWEQFQAAVINVPVAVSDAHEAYERATIMAEPVLSTETPAGFPTAPVDAVDGAEPAPADAGAQRRQKEQDERELIMDRLLDEEQAQEEADARVSAMKTRLDALRKKREAARQARAKTS